MKQMSFSLQKFNPCPAKPTNIPFLENSVDQDQLASDEASWSGSALLSLQKPADVDLHCLHAVNEFTLY